MMRESEISNEHLVRALRIWVVSLIDKHDPHRKDEAYFRNLAGWIAEAANRLEKLTPRDESA